MSEEKQPKRGTVRFHPHEVYSFEALGQMLGDIVKADRFLRTLRVPRRFKNAVLGSDIIRALENPPEGSELGDKPAVVASATLRALESPRGGSSARKPRRHGTSAALRQIKVEEVLQSGH